MGNEDCMQLPLKTDTLSVFARSWQSASGDADYRREGVRCGAPERCSGHIKNQECRVRECIPVGKGLGSVAYSCALQCWAKNWKCFHNILIETSDPLGETYSNLVNVYLLHVM